MTVFLHGMFHCLGIEFGYVHSRHQIHYVQGPVFILTAVVKMKVSKYNLIFCENLDASIGNLIS